MGGHGKSLLSAPLFAIVMAFLAATAVSQALPGCPERCGDVAIPYPFGVGNNCSLETKFNMTCDDPAGPAPKAYMWTSSINATEISVGSGELRILQSIAKDCYAEAGPRDLGRSSPFVYLWFPTGFSISASRNKFFTVGCDTYALVQGFNRQDERLTTGCMSLCDGTGSVADESCSGAGCCEVTIPAQLKNQSLGISSIYNHSSVWGFNPCSYAFTVESGMFNFSGVSSFKALETMDKLPMIVDWSVGDQPCAEARAGNGSYHCKGNSRCEDSNTGIGYLCKCSPGYQGNPYHPDGCQDIDECMIGNHCNGTCINTPGSYSCSCDKGFTLTDDGTLCIKDVESSGSERALIYTLSGVSVGVVALVSVSLMLCVVHKKRKLIRQKEKFFEQNGGLMLQRRLCNSTNDKKGAFEAAKIFTEEELIKATNNYEQILGEGGYGIVYKGTLPDKRAVAIKKPKVGAQTQTQQQTEQFINEIILLMQINHRNVVRLLGCCLDTEVPILVYEFITNGTLFERIHKKGSSEEPSLLRWELRLKIAAEAAGALAYLHSETNTPILHRDVNYTAKVSDFGTSRLVPLDQEELSTLVQGTIGYLDPEYLQSSQLTDKSDVYSFGVVLAELLTGKKALSFDKSAGTTNNLAISFLLLKENDQLRGLVDEDIDYEANVEVIRDVANLARRCLRIKGEERPTMKEVAMELEGMQAMSSKHPWGKFDHLNAEENDHLLGSASNINQCGEYDLESSSSVTTSVVYDSMQNQSVLLRPYNDGR